MTNQYPAFLFLSSFIFLIFGLIIYFKAKNKIIERTFNLFVFSFAVWSFSLGMFFLVSGVENTIFWGKVVYFSASYIPPSFLLFSFIFPNTKITKFNYKYLLFFIPNLFFFPLFFYTSLIIENIKIIEGVKTFIYGDWKLLWDVQFNGLLILGFIRYVRMFLRSKGVIKEQLRYLLIGDLYIYMFAGTTNVFLPLFSIFDYIWMGPILSLVWVFLISYTIAKHNLLDIKLIITRASIFVLVYAFVLGIPLWLGFRILGNGLWIVPVVLMAIFSTVGPFIFLFLQKRAEDKLLQDQRRYQLTLRQAATGMGRIKQLKKLLNLVVYVVTRAVHLEHTLIYLLDDTQKAYILNAFKSRKQSISYLDRVMNDSLLIAKLKQSRAPINFEQFQYRIKNQSDYNLKEIEKTILSLKGELILPIHIEDKLLAFIVFGSKDSGKSFTDEDLTVFSSLTNQIALAIENAQFYEEVKRTQEKLFQAEKMATIGTMADGLSHQINNRFHAMGFIAGDALDTIKITKDKGIPDNFKETFDDLERAFTRVQENVVQGGEIVQGLLRYTRKGDAGMTAVEFDAVLKSSFEMAQFKIKTNELRIVRDFDENIPKIKGNFTQLQEVFFNLIDNAYDAMMQRKSEKMEIGFQPTMIITVKPQGNLLEIIMEDNGIGVKDDDREKLFTPFFTTKLSSKKGTGLGLYVIRKIIEENHGGTVEMSSRYMIGTKMKINLPIVF